MKISALTRRGQGKTTSDDRILAGIRILCDEEYCFESERDLPVGVADGVGGNAGGDAAAQFVCERLTQCEPTSESIAAVNNDLIALAWKTPGRETMATTFSGIFPGGKLLHIGNTRIYAVQGGYLKQLTEDMTTYNYLLSMGRKEESERCSRSEITACFGGGKKSLFQPKLTEYALCGALMMTSDGVHDHVGEDVLEEILSTSESDIISCRRIAEAAVKCGSEDDVSVLVVRT